MLESISISNPTRTRAFSPFSALLFSCLAFSFVSASPTEAKTDPKEKKDKTLQPEEDDFQGTPYTDYGEFNEESEEAADTKFFQHGRFFGFSFGAGYQSATGNRGGLWQGGFPLIDFKIHYWFDFNLALDLNFTTNNHYFDYLDGSTSIHSDVAFQKYLLSIKYYFDTKNLSAAISFANPYVLISFGNYRKVTVSTLSADKETDNNVGFNFGGGFEFPVKHRKIYIEVEGRAHFVTFADTKLPTFKSTQPSFDDMTGVFYSATASVLFTW